MSRPAFTETHVHFHDLREPQLCYSWLLPGVEPDELLGDYGAIRAERYWADDFVAETRFQNVERVIHVQAAIGTEDPVQETAWLQRFHDRLGVPHGAIAYADLTADDRDQILDRHVEHSILRESATSATTTTSRTSAGARGSNGSVNLASFAATTRPLTNTRSPRRSRGCTPARPYASIIAACRLAEATRTFSSGDKRLGLWRSPRTW